MEYSIAACGNAMNRTKISQQGRVRGITRKVGLKNVVLHKEASIRLQGGLAMARNSINGDLQTILPVA